MQVLQAQNKMWVPANATAAVCIANIAITWGLIQARPCAQQYAPLLCQYLARRMGSLLQLAAADVGSWPCNAAAA